LAACPVDPLDFDRVGVGYNIAWMFMLGSVRLITERFATYRTARQIKTAHVVD